MTCRGLFSSRLKRLLKPKTTSFSFIISWYQIQTKSGIYCRDDVTDDLIDVSVNMNQSQGRKMERTAILQNFHDLVKCVGHHRDECAVLYMDRDSHKLVQIGTKLGENFFTERPAYSMDFLTFCSQELIKTVEGAVEVAVKNDVEEDNREDSTFLDRSAEINKTCKLKGKVPKSLYPIVSKSATSELSSGITTRRKAGLCTPKRHFPEYDVFYSMNKRRKKESDNKIKKVKDVVQKEEHDENSTGGNGEQKVLNFDTKEDSNVINKCSDKTYETTEKDIVSDVKENWSAVNDENDDELEDLFDDSVDDNDEEEIKKSETQSENSIKAEVKPECLQCNKVFRNTAGLNTHLIRSGHEQECKTETDFKCYSCFKSYQREWDLIRHMKNTQHTGNDEAFINRKLMPVIAKKDETNIKKKTIYRCSCCKATYRGLERGEDHIKLGACVPKVSKKCPCCLAVFHDKNSLQVHIKKEHKDDYPFICKICGNQFYDIRYFKSHAKWHEKVESTENNDSAVLDGNIQDIQNRLNGQSDGEANDAREESYTEVDPAVNDIGKKLSLSCISTSGRGKMHRHVLNLQRQIRDVTDSQAIIKDTLDREQTCIICFAEFINYAQLKIHIVASGHEQVQTEESGYRCFTCNKYFAKFVDLEYHMEITSHTGNQDENKERRIEKINPKGVQKKFKHFRCSLCATAFPTIQKCQNHISKASCESKRRRKCICCDMYFQRENLLQAHMYQYHSYDYPFKCDFCPEEFTLISPYFAHRNSHLSGPDKVWNEEQMECKICKRKFTEKHLLERHVKKSHHSQADIDHVDSEVINTIGSSETTNFKCFSCDLFFANYQSLILHMKETFHTGLPEKEKEINVTRAYMSKMSDKSVLKPYRCSRCHTVFGIKQNAEEHVAKATCKPYFKKACPCCPEIFSTKNLFEAHLLDRHKDEYPFKCQDCSKIFYQLSGLITHCTKIHDKETVDVRPKGLKSYPCPICQRTLSRKSDVRHHIKKVHHKENKTSIVCDICGKSYSSAKVLKTHIEHVHTDSDNPGISCPDCGKVLKNKICLYSHIHNMHSRRGEVICEDCGYKAKTKAMLEYHRASKHSEGDKFQCEECGAGFKIKGHFHIHLANHYIDRGDLAQAKQLTTIYECEICHKHFPNKTRCEEHTLSHLGDRAKLECKLCGLRVMNAVKGLKTHYKQDVFVKHHAPVGSLPLTTCRSNCKVKVAESKTKHKLCKSDIDELTKDEISVKYLLARLKKEMIDKDIPVPVLKEHPTRKQKTGKGRNEEYVEEDETVENVMDISLKKEDSDVDYLEDEEYVVSTSAPNIDRKTTVLARDYDAEAQSQITFLIQTAGHAVEPDTEMIVIEQVPPGSTL